MWKKIPGIAVFLVADGPAHIDSLIHSPPETRGIFPRSCLLFPQKGFSLNVFRDGQSSQTQDRGAKVNKSNHPIGSSARSSRGQMLIFFRKTDDQRHVQPGIVQETLAPS